MSELGALVVYWLGEGVGGGEEEGERRGGGGMCTLCRRDTHSPTHHTVYLAELPECSVGEDEDDNLLQVLHSSAANHTPTHTHTLPHINSIKLP